MFNSLMMTTGKKNPDWVLKQREDFNNFDNFGTLYGNTYKSQIINDPSDANNKILDPNGSSSITPSGTWSVSVVTNHEKRKMVGRVKAPIASTSYYWDYIYCCGFLVQSGNSNNNPGHYPNSIQLADIFPVYMNLTGQEWYVVEVIFEPDLQALTEDRTLVVDGVVIGTQYGVAITETPAPAYIYFGGRSTHNLVFLDYIEMYKFE